MEFDTLEKSNTKLTEENKELHKTMEDLMNTLQKVVDEANARKNDFTAQVGILETEMSQLRSQFQAQKQTLTTVNAAHAKLQTDHDEQTQHLNEQTAQFDKLRTDYDTLRSQYDKLRGQAQEKLSASANEYRLLLAKNQEKDAIIQQLNADLQLARTKAQQNEQRLHELESAHSATTQQCARAESNLATKTSELNELRTQLQTVNAQLMETRVKLDESQQVGDRYKAQVVEYREKLRDVDQTQQLSQELEREHTRLSGEVSTLTQENQNLKSQLFDSFQTEKALRAQLEGLGMSQSAVSDTAARARLEAELATLKQTLATKESEHKELMDICNGLIAQVETLKGQQAS